MDFYPEAAIKLLGGEVSSVYLDEFHHSHPTLLTRSLYVAECVNCKKN